MPTYKAVLKVSIHTYTYVEPVTHSPGRNRWEKASWFYRSALIKAMSMF